MRFIIENATIYPMDSDIIESGYVLCEGGKIINVGRMSDRPDCDVKIEADGGILLPGLIDAHSHIGLFNEGIRFEGEDGNEDTDPITPQLRALDAIYPQDKAFYEARMSGVTTVVTGPGSANPIGGQFAAVKTRGICVDDMLVKQSASMKFALGENPKMTYNQKDRAPVTRMATAALIREMLLKTQEYTERREDEEEDCDFDIKLASLEEVLSGKVPAHFHCHRADDIFTALRISREFNLKTTLVHATEGYLIADKLVQANTPVICGPIMTTRSKPELANQSASNAAELIKKGALVAICTDYPEVPQDYLMLSAALAAREGISDIEALRAITINAAEVSGISDRVGSITSGKDADLVLYDRHPFDTRAKVRGVWIEGERIV